MCLVSRQLGFVISPKFSYYLVPRSTTSPLILSSLVSQHPDILRFAFSPFFLSLPFFFSPPLSPSGYSRPIFPSRSRHELATLQSTRITTVSPTACSAFLVVVQACHLILTRSFERESEREASHFEASSFVSIVRRSGDGRGVRYTFV